MSRSVRIVSVGAFASVQDAGRPGMAHLGVPRSGWLDPVAATLANRLVGNDEGAAVLECVLGGLVLEVSSASTVAVTGASCPVRVVPPGGAPRWAGHGAAVAVPAGTRVELGAVSAGLRCYVAVGGGIAVAPVLGSRSTDTLSGLGPAPLEDGTVLPLGSPTGSPSPAEALPMWRGQVAALRCTPGPRVHWFSAGTLEALAGATYTVSSDSDRVGLRLSGPRLGRSVEGELPSEGIVLGAVQVPADGQPLVFLNDHPTTGGYPVIAVVDLDDLARCAQLRPGDRVRFRPGAGALDRSR